MQPESICRMRFNEKVVVEALLNKYKNFEPDWHQCPRNCVSRGAFRVKYKNWFHSDRNKLIQAFIPLPLAQTLMRFKLNSTYFKCYHHNRPRRERVCFACNSGTLEDELHIVFECPKYSHIRGDQKWQHIFSVCSNEGNINKKMNLFFNQDNQYKLACFVFSLISQRNRYLKFGVPYEPVVDMFSDSD